MSATIGLLADLRARGIEVKAAGERLRYRPARAVDDDLRQRMLRHKRELLSIFGSPERSEAPLADTRIDRRLSRLLQGRLWHDRAGWWPKDTGLPRAEAEERALEAMTREPDDTLPEPGSAIAARGLNAIRAWRQIVVFLPHRVGWSVDRSSRVANLIVSTGWHIVEPGERRS